MRFALVSALAAFSSLAHAADATTFQLQVFQGFHFGKQQVTRSGADTADLNFTYQTRRVGMISYLGADKIKFFESAPASVPASDIEKWKDYEAGPAPGFYVVRARSTGRTYLVELVSFENQGKAASQWRMTFKWRDFPAR